MFLRRAILAGLTTTFFVLVGLTLTACDERVCGDGTVDLDNVCQVLNMPDGGAGEVCGPFTTNVNGVCIPLTQVCGPNTDPVVMTTDGGVDFFQCIGRGGGDLCTPEPCPDAQPGGPICVSGCARFLVDPDDSGNLMETLIADDNALADATRIEVLVYDPLAYAGNPNVPPLGVSEVNPLTGTWKVENIAVPATNFIAVIVEDYTFSPNDDFIFAGFPYAAQAGQNLEIVDAFGITGQQNSDWSTAIGDAALQTAGCAAGATLHSCGTWVGVFGYKDAGNLRLLDSIVPKNNALDIPFEKSFFMNTAHDDFTAPADQASSITNSSGIIFYPTASLGQYGGACANATPDSECETQNYTWDLTRLGGAAPDAIFIQIMNPEQHPTE